MDVVQRLRLSKTVISLPCNCSLIHIKMVNQHGRQILQRGTESDLRGLFLQPIIKVNFNSKLTPMRLSFMLEKMRISKPLCWILGPDGTSPGGDPNARLLRGAVCRAMWELYLPSTTEWDDNGRFPIVYVPQHWDLFPVAWLEQLALTWHGKSVRVRRETEYTVDPVLMPEMTAGHCYAAPASPPHFTGGRRTSSTAAHLPWPGCRTAPRRRTCSRCHCGAECPQIHARSGGGEQRPGSSRQGSLRP